MIRLQRVTLLALQQYLGLSAELIAKQVDTLLSLVTDLNTDL